MRSFDLVEPATIAEACAVIANDDDAKVIAGGTALLILIVLARAVAAVAQS